MTRKRNPGMRAKYRRQRQKKRASKATTTIIRNPSTITDITRVKLRYSEIVNLTSTDGTFPNRVYRANSIWQPNLVVSAEQPYGRDQWANFYGRYLVTGMAAQVTAVSQPTPTSAGGVCLSLVDATGEPTSYLKAVEMPYSNTMLIAPFETRAKKLKLYCSTKKRAGYKDIDTQDDLSATITGNPSELYYWVLGLQATQNPGTITASFQVEITYYVKLYDRKELGRS